ncbi:MAG: hypothetical protein AAGP08_14965 [Pseudomonadota bacterium]
MTDAYGRPKQEESDWRDALSAAIGFEWPRLMNIEWLIEKAETGAWGRQ